METYELSSPDNVRLWLHQTNHAKQLALLDKFEMELRLGRLSTSSKKSKVTSATEDMSNTAYGLGGVQLQDRRQVTFRTVELLRALVGNTKWKNAAQLMILLRGIGKELNAAGGGKEPAISNIVRRIMSSVRDEVANAEAQEAVQISKKQQDMDDVNMEGTMEPIDEEGVQSFKNQSTYKGKSSSSESQMSRNLSLASMLWAHPQHLIHLKRADSSNSATRTKRSDSFSSVDSGSGMHLAAHENDFPPTFYQKWQNLRPAVMEAIQEIMLDLEDLHKNIDDTASSHIHAGEVILTYSRSKTVESFLKAAAKKRQFQVIVCEGAPHFGGHSMAKSLADAGIDTTVIHDSAAFAIMARVNKVLLPAHAVLANGGLIAPSGCHMIALAAAHNSVPLVCLTGMYKLCPTYPHEGQDTLQDLVSPHSIVDYAELSDRIKSDVEFVNPVHDYIPPQTIGLYVTNIGAFQPSYIYRLLAEYYHQDDWEAFE